MNVFKNMWLFRKAILTKFFQIHYSQFGEDIILRELLRKEVKNGFYVDVGCYHPKKYSNTFMLYKRGWRGINIDMEEDKVKLFNWVRPQDTNILGAISDKSEEVTLYRFGKYSLESTIDATIAKNINQDVYEKRVVQTKTLNQILEDSAYKGRQIDLLTIDVEGMDFKVLKSLNLETYKPKIIIIEDHHKTINQILETNTHEFLSNNSYNLRSWTFYSLFYVLPGSDILKNRENEQILNNEN